MKVKLYNWNQVEEQQITPLLTRRYISSERITLARFFLKQGCQVQSHSHEIEQLTTVLSGTLKLILAGEEVNVGSGETLWASPRTLRTAPKPLTTATCSMLSLRGAATGSKGATLIYAALKTSKFEVMSRGYLCHL